MRRAAKVDQNQAQIVEALEKTGWLVKSLANVGQGFPDLLAYHVRTMRFALVEVKQPKGKLTPLQVSFHGRWPVYVCRTVDDVLKLGQDRGGRTGAQ